MASTRLAGHGLEPEGKPYVPDPDRPGKWTRPWSSPWTGVALCECGWSSAELTSDNQRKRAHRIHKEQVRCADGTARAEALLGGDVYPCTGNHDDGFHHFHADLPEPCPAPFCKLPYSHYVAGTMHDIPSGRATYRTREITRNA